jgi:hypothetical protein
VTPFNPTSFISLNHNFSLTSLTIVKKVKIKTRPPPPIFPANKPDVFYRVTDSSSHFQFGKVVRTGASSPHVAFSIDGENPCFKHGPLYYTIEEQTILFHLQDKSRTEEEYENEWRWFIAAYDNTDAARKKAQKRKVMGKKEVKIWQIDGKWLYWKKDKLTKTQEDGQEVEIEIDVLTDFSSDFGYPVLFVSVVELVSKLDLKESLKGRNVNGEWLAVGWIPMELVKAL